MRIWHGTVLSAENSQHIADWYTPSHVVHGMLFYGFLASLAGFAPIGLRLVLATIVETVWEIVENTDAIINRYREATIALDYYGDSILNSSFDILFMMVGFALARVLPIGWTIVLALVFEAGVAYMIRDNLTLNVLMLLYPLEAVRSWQGGG